MTDIKTAQSQALSHVYNYVQQNIMQQGCVERMTMLRERYQLHVQENAPNCFDPNFRTSSLKILVTRDWACIPSIWLVTHFGDRLRFFNPSNNRGDLVFSSELEIGEAVGAAFDATASETRILREAAFILRRDITDAYKNSPTMEWPPSVDFVQSGDIFPPSSLTQFLLLLLSGRASNCSERITRVSQSIAEDICSATTAARWKMAKHLLLAVSLHHLTGSAELVTLLNRFGHCTNYSAVLELETAMANALVLSDSVLPSNISATDNKFSHTVWDNFDILEETPSGSGTTHSAHGIVIQEVMETDVADTEVPCRQLVPITKKRSVAYTPQAVQPCFSKKHVEPSSTGAVSVPSVDTSPLEQPVFNFEGLWLICRKLFPATLAVPEWSGWISLLSPQPMPMQSKIGYLTPILEPITEYFTVAECLTMSIKVSSELRQSFTFVTMDLAAARIAYDIIFDDVVKQQSDMSRVIIHIGAFHTMCAYMGALGHMMSGSGFEEVLIEANLCASGSIHKVMAGKHFNRAIRVHQCMLEALEGLMLDEFLQLETKHDLCSHTLLQQLASKPAHKSFLACAACPECSEFINSYCQFKNSIRSGEYGNTATFWIMYCDCVWTLMQYQRAIKENDFDNFLLTLRQMMAMMFAADRLNYAKYLPLYYTQMTSLDAQKAGSKPTT